MEVDLVGCPEDAPLPSGEEEADERRPPDIDTRPVREHNEWAEGAEVEELPTWLFENFRGIRPPAEPIGHSLGLFVDRKKSVCGPDGRSSRALGSSGSPSCPNRNLDHFRASGPCSRSSRLNATPILARNSQTRKAPREV